MKFGNDFYEKDVLNVAPMLLGKTLVRLYDTGEIKKFVITETEAYRGEEDLACHASKGRTPRTEVMYMKGGVIYVYLIYGMFWMLNFVTGKINFPQAVLIRGLDNIKGPGRVSKILQIDKSFYGENLIDSNRIWVENNNISTEFLTYPRVGIDYAGEIWKNKEWRFILNERMKE
jgi:DNA-3-methyladenine glycosylase